MNTKCQAALIQTSCELLRKVSLNLSLFANLGKTDKKRPVDIQIMLSLSSFHRNNSCCLYQIFMETTLVAFIKSNTGINPHDIFVVAGCLQNKIKDMSINKKQLSRSRRKCGKSRMKCKNLVWSVENLV